MNYICELLVAYPKKSSRKLNPVDDEICENTVTLTTSGYTIYSRKQIIQAFASNLLNP